MGPRQQELRTKGSEMGRGERNARRWEHIGSSASWGPQAFYPTQGLSRSLPRRSQNCPLGTLIPNISPFLDCRPITTEWVWGAVSRQKWEAHGAAVACTDCRAEPSPSRCGWVTAVVEGGSHGAWRVLRWRLRGRRLTLTEILLIHF